MKNQILKLGKVLNKAEQKAINGGRKNGDGSPIGIQSELCWNGVFCKKYSNTCVEDECQVGMN